MIGLRLARELTFWRAALVCAAIWSLVPSSLFLRPHSLTVSAVAGGYEAAFARATPLGSVRAAWHTEVQGRVECDAQDDGLTRYEARGLEVVPFRIEPGLAACLGPDQPFAYVTTHTVFLAGLVPLRPATTVWLCPALGKPCRLA
ncbi:hypothetical protein ACGYK5_17800 [Sulfitobacter sp. 1A16787]|uniref:hypothetical protein n=1 Tax=Sulfitobacter sp. 1A16787 TaxID=3368571 RepID=UPI0037462BF5